MPITLTWNYELPEGKEVDHYSVIYGQKRDLSDGYRVDGNNEDTISFNNAFLGRNYYQLIATFTDGSTEEGPIRRLEVNSSYPRNLTIEGMTNCRDIGGRKLPDGRRIKQGLIYRTSGKNQNGSLTEKTKEEMVNHLGVKNEINLAGDSSSYNLKLEGTNLITSCRMDTSSTGGFHHLSRNTEAVKNFFYFIANEENYPLFYHCKIGTDRTGLCTVLLHGLLGMSLNDIYQDYLFSNFGKIGEKRGIGTGDSHDMLKYIDDILTFSGKTFQDKVYNTLLAIDVSKETLDTVRSNLIEETGITRSALPKNTIAGPAEFLTAEGVEITTDSSERNNPDNYFVLDSEDKSVSLTFDASEDFTGQVVAYLGNPDASTSKKIADAISVTIDGDNMPIRDVTYKDARMGKCTVNGSSRTNYFPVILGTYDLTKGNHTITMTGSSNTMNLGGIYIFDNAFAGGSNEVN